ncbi:hypothetical protein Tco_0343613 [Tanacetum coccineum]
MQQRKRSGELKFNLKLIVTQMKIGLIRAKIKANAEIQRVESFAPINFEATKDSLKIFGEELQTKASKRLKSDEAKDDEPTKKSRKRRKQMARKRLHTDLFDKDDLKIQESYVNKMILFQSTLFELGVNGYIYMLIERKYPLSAEICKTMQDKKLQGGKPDEDMLKMFENDGKSKAV